MVMQAETDDGSAAASSWREEVGALLRVARERQGLAVEDIADRLKLRSAFVVAVEDGRGKELMEETYEWSHIKSIASLLEIDVEARG